MSRDFELNEDEVEKVLHSWEKKVDVQVLSEITAYLNEKAIIAAYWKACDEAEAQEVKDRQLFFKSKGQPDDPDYRAEDQRERVSAEGVEAAYGEMSFQFAVKGHLSQNDITSHPALSARVLEWRLFEQAKDAPQHPRNRL